jgi:hypothetical protein
MTDVTIDEFGLGDSLPVSRYHGLSMGCIEIA